MIDQVRLAETVVQGFPAVLMDNGVCSVTVVPALGGKIASLADLRSGREWLWSNDQLPYRQVPYGMSYTQEADSGGWDECFPTVAPCHYPAPPRQGIALPDHGELWALPCELTIERDAQGGVGLVTEASSLALPCVFRRRIYLAPGQSTLRCTYTLTSCAHDPLLFIWCAHPLLRIEPGMRVVLPESTRLHPAFVLPAHLNIADDPLCWPVQCRLEGRTIDCARLPGESGVAFKLWSAPRSAGWAALEADDGALFFEFDPALVPHVGLWVNLGGWSGTGGPAYYNLAIEPGIGAQESLEDAVRGCGQYGTLPSQGTLRWSLDVHLRSYATLPSMEQCI